MTNLKIGGWIPDPSNKNYQPFLQSNFTSNSSLLDVDLRLCSSPRHSQKSSGSCVAQSLVKALEIKRIIKHGISNHVDLSVLDLYWNSREKMEPSQTDKDEGTYISLACEVLKENGVCRESTFPFSVESLFLPPPIMSSREGRLNRISSHFKITSEGQDRIDDMIFNLRCGNPVVFGTGVGNLWTNYNNTSSPIDVDPTANGGHAMCCVGYVSGLFIVENSWGNSWGYDGFAFVKPDVFKDSATSDIWVIVDGSEIWTEV